MGPFPKLKWGASGSLDVFGTFFYIYEPGPTIYGVEALEIKGANPGTYLLNPNEYLFGFGISCLKLGLYCGPGVPLCLFGSFGN